MQNAELFSTPMSFPHQTQPPRRYCCSPANSAPFQSYLESPPPNCGALRAPFSQEIHDQMTLHCMVAVVQGLGQSSQCPLYTGTQCPSNPWGFTLTYAEEVGSDGLESKTTQRLCSHRCLYGPPSPPPLCPSSWMGHPAAACTQAGWADSGYQEYTAEPRGAHAIYLF